MSSGEFELHAPSRGFFGEDAPVQCSRAGCNLAATVRIEWRNPRIHTADRGKVWLACDEHRAFLLGFLQARDFPVRVAAMGDPVAQEPIQ